MSFQDLDGVIHVTYGVLVVFWWNCAPYVKRLRSILSCKLDGLTVQMLQMLIKKCNWFQGEALFQTHENLEHLAMMERVLGPLPQHMLKRAECVPIWGFLLLMSAFWCFIEKRLFIHVYYYSCFSRHAEKYVRRGRLDWPEGATSRESIKSVMKLPRLQVCKMIYFPRITSLGNDVQEKRCIWFCLAFYGY